MPSAGLAPNQTPRQDFMDWEQDSRPMREHPTRTSERDSERLFGLWHVRSGRLPIWIIFYAIIIHYAWAVMLVLSPDALGATPIHTMHTYIDNRFVLAASLALVATIAQFGMVFFRDARCAVTFAVPQQFFLVLTAMGAVSAVLTGTYADGVPRPHMFILADQFPSILIAVVHTFALLDLAGVPRWMRK